MATKRCAFRGCGLFTNPTHPCPETFYAFPKDPERCKIWLKLGACRGQIPYSMRYFCSKHFDESKYVAHNQRRKQLLSTAIPWPYTESPQKEVIAEEVDYQCVVSTIDDDEDDAAAIERIEEDAVSVEVSNDITNISDTIEDALQSYEYHEVSDVNEFSIALPTTEKKSLKRKLDTLIKKTSPAAPSDDTRPGPSNPATSSTAIGAHDELKLDDYLDESKIIDSSDLTTFIFKGQEYIQMPKEDYVNEKMALMQKIKSYEEVLKNIKHLMDGVWI